MTTSVTLAESAKLSDNMLASGVLENIITTNQAFSVIPFMGVEGNAYTYNRENALGDVQILAVNGQFTATAAATFTQKTASLTTLGGKALVNGLIQSTRSNITDQAAVQIASKAKNLGRKFNDLFINGDVDVSGEFDGLVNMVSNGQTVAAAGADGDVLSFEKLDNLISLITAKDGQVDFIMANDRELRRYMTLLRAQGGASINETVALPGGGSVIGYRGIPIFRNDYIAVNGTVGSSTDAASIFGGVWDDGSGIGVSGLTSMNDAGVRVVPLGQVENSDAQGYHVLWYTSAVCGSDKALAAITGIVPA